MPQFSTTVGLPLMEKGEDRTQYLQEVYQMCLDYQRAFHPIWTRGRDHYKCKIHDTDRHPSRLMLCYPLIKNSITSIVAQENQFAPRIQVNPHNAYLSRYWVDGIKKLMEWNWRQARITSVLTRLGTWKEMLGTAFLKPVYEQRWHWEDRLYPVGDINNPDTWQLEADMYGNYTDEQGNPNYKYQSSPYPVVDFQGVSWKVVQPGNVLVPPETTGITAKGGLNPERILIERDTIDFDVAMQVPWYNKKAVEKYIHTVTTPDKEGLNEEWLENVGIQVDHPRKRKITILRYYFPETGAQIDWPAGSTGDIFYEGKNLFGVIPLVRFVSEELVDSFYGLPRWRNAEDLSKAATWMLNWEVEHRAFHSVPTFAANKNAISDPRNFSVKAGGVTTVDLLPNQKIHDHLQKLDIPQQDPFAMHQRLNMVQMAEESIGVNKQQKGISTGRGTPTEIMEAAAGADVLTKKFLREFELGVNDALQMTLGHFRRHQDTSMVIPAMVLGKEGESARDFLMSPAMLQQEYQVGIESGTLGVSSEVEKRTKLIEMMQLLSAGGFLNMINSEELVRSLMRVYDMPESEVDRLMKSTQQIQQEAQQAEMMAAMEEQNGEVPPEAAGYDDAYQDIESSLQ